MNQVVRRSPEEYVAAALGLLDRYGPADPTLSVSMTAAAGAAGVTRSTIYRIWESAGDLNDDVARYVTICFRGWQRALLDQPFETPTAEAFTRAIDSAPAEPGIGARGVIAGWPSTNQARADVAAWERAWVVALERWLEGHLHATGRQLDGEDGLRVAAVTLAALVEGELFMATSRTGADPAAWDPEASVAIGRAAARLVESFSDTAPPGAPTPTTTWPSLDAPDGLSRPARKMAVLEALVEHYRHQPFGGPASPAPGRIVDMARLARHLGVSERRLFDIWPTAEDVNVDIIRASAARLRREAEEVTAEVFAIGVSDEFTSFDQLHCSALHSMVVAGTRADRASVFSVFMPMADPAVRRETADLLDEWAATARTIFLAALAMAGWYRRVDVTADDYARTMTACTFGLQRLATLDRDLLDETATLRGATVPLLGKAAMRVVRSLSTDQAPTRVVDAPREAPPLTGRS